MKNEIFQINISSEGILHVVFDLPQEKVNLFNIQAIEELDQLLDELAVRAQSEKWRALIFESQKENIFIAGADIKLIQEVQTYEEAKDKAQRGHSVFNKIAQFPIPTFAYINGACLGGGLEMALACSFRLVSDHPKTILALPEVGLGIIPGWGGTQRLPRLIGIENSLPFILSGKTISAKKAWKLHLADALLSKEFFSEQALAFVQQCLRNPSLIIKKRNPFSIKKFLLEKNPLGRKLLFYLAEKNLLKRTKGDYPAPLAALKTVEETSALSIEEGMKIEIEEFSKLATTPICKNLIHLYFAQEQAKKSEPSFHKPIHRTGILGGGIMGGGIAWLFSYRGGPVRLKDINWKAIAAGYQKANDIYGQLIKIRKITPQQVNLKMHQISGTTDFSGFQDLDLVVEAIVEDFNIKKQALKQLEENVSSDTIICSNTSSFSINELAKGLKHPERFLGMHFFNPVNRMPLVEVIPHEKTDPEITKRCVQFLKQMHKVPIVVGDCAGFLVNRLLLPYLNESMWMLHDGFDFEKIDHALLKFGMPMGPFQLTDEVGIDIAQHAGKSMQKAYGDRMPMPKTLDQILHHELLGKKNKRGFYLHEGKTRKRNPVIDQIRAVVPTTNQSCSNEEISSRLIAVMVNEASRALEENIAPNANILDLAMIMGSGYPPFRGGPLRYADSIGLSKIQNTLERLQDKYGNRFEPSPLLKAKVKEKSTFTT